MSITMIFLLYLLAGFILAGCIFYFQWRDGSNIYIRELVLFLILTPMWPFLCFIGFIVWLSEDTDKVVIKGRKQP